MGGYEGQNLLIHTSDLGHKLAIVIDVPQNGFVKRFHAVQHPETRCMQNPVLHTASDVLCASAERARRSRPALVLVSFAV